MGTIEWNRGILKVTSFTEMADRWHLAAIYVFFTTFCKSVIYKSWLSSAKYQWLNNQGAIFHDPVSVEHMVFHIKLDFMVSCMRGSKWGEISNFSLY